MGDAHRLSQVLENLLDNALKYTPMGGAITISAQAWRARGAAIGSTEPLEAVLRDHNTGSTFPADDVEQVFERFYQVDRSRARTLGQGLGLAIAQQVVHAHRGTIGVVSNEAGTTFVVRLALVEGVTESALSSNLSVDDRSASLRAAARM